MVNEEIAKRLARDGHEVIFLVGGFKGCALEETIDGYKVVRLGNRWSVYWKAWRYYKKNLRGWADLVIDEVNTMPFFCKFYVREKNILFVHQLCREIWFYEMAFPLNVLGYALEPIYLWLLRDGSFHLYAKDKNAPYYFTGARLRDSLDGNFFSLSGRGRLRSRRFVGRAVGGSDACSVSPGWRWMLSPGLMSLVSVKAGSRSTFMKDSLFRRVGAI